MDRLEAFILKIERVVVNTAANEILDETDIRQQMGGLWTMANSQEAKLNSILAFLRGPPSQYTPPAKPSPTCPNAPRSGHSGPVVYYACPHSHLHGQQPRGPPQGIPQGTRQVNS